MSWAPVPVKPVRPSVSDGVEAARKVAERLDALPEHIRALAAELSELWDREDISGFIIHRAKTSALLAELYRRKLMDDPYGASGTLFDRWRQATALADKEADILRRLEAERAANARDSRANWMMGTDEDDEPDGNGS